MGISYGPYKHTLSKQEKVEAFRRGMHGGITRAKTEGFLGKLVHGPDRTKTTVKEKYKLTDEQETTYNEYVEKVNENIQKNITNSMNKMVTNIMVDVVTKNDNILDVIASGSNVLTISDSVINGEDVIISVNQSQDVTVEASMDAQTTVMNEIKSSVSSKASETILDQAKDGERLGEAYAGVVKNAIGAAAGVANNAISTGGEVMNNAISEVGNVVNNTVDAVAGLGTAVVDGMFGAGSRTTTNTDTEKDITVKTKTDTDITNIQKELSEKINTVNLENITKTAMDNNLSTETLNECKASAEGVNSTVFKNLTVNATRLAKLDITQQNKIQMVVKCVTNTEIVNKISTEVLMGIENAVTNMDLSEGTLEAAGAAVAGAVVAAGDATSTAAQGVGEGTSTAAQGIGSGVASAATGMQSAFIVMGVVAVAFLMMNTDQGGQQGY